MKRILIIGCPGAGKSELTRKIANILGLPIIHLDLYYWQRGWQRPKRSQWDKVIADLIAGNAWIIDGHYAGTLEQRLIRADTVIHLDFSTHICFWRVLRRTIKGYGKTRDNELVDGCPERFSFKFLWFVLNYKRKHRKVTLGKLTKFEGVEYRFKKTSELKYFLQELN